MCRLLRLQRQGREPEAHRAADEADDLQVNAPDPIGQQHRGQDADDQQHIEQRRALGGQDVARNQRLTLLSAMVS